MCCAAAERLLCLWQKFRGGLHRSVMSDTTTTPLPPPDAVAVLDEAGLTAKVSNLTRDHDGKIGLVAARHSADA